MCVFFGLGNGGQKKKSRVYHAVRNTVTDRDEMINGTCPRHPILCHMGLGTVGLFVNVKGNISHENATNVPSLILLIKSYL
jgi:hypothetical protein